MSDTNIRCYLKKIEAAQKGGNATEHTYRSYLKELLESLYPGTTATNEPKRVACGAPDFIITKQQTPLGYIETKDIGISLDKVEHSDQMKRYLGSLGNLILTDYVEFRWYVAGQHRVTARLVKASKGKWTPETDGIEQVSKLLQGFLITQTPTVNTPKELATRMASIAQLIRNAISLAFKSEYGVGSLHEQMEGFRQVLLPDLDPEKFGDMYAQTICYGLFAARCNAKPNTPFTREHAAYDIPKTNPFLRKMFGYIAGPELDESIVWAVDDLAEVLNRSDMQAILRDFGKRTRQEDPIVHFYETFLAAYDPKMRAARGVYYTPEPVVSYIVRSVDHILKKDFGLPDGLADATKIKEVSTDGKRSIEAHKVQILDPATGTGTFLHSVIDLIYESFQNNKGMWSSYVSEHLLPRLFGFELLMAPFAVAHMKLGLQLAETGYDFRSNERLRVYLTNTLEEGFEGGKLPFAEWLIEEATAAGNIKHDAPVMVVIGNPPYSNYGMMNKGGWIRGLLKDYKKGLNEKKLNLDDDFIKFIRFGQWHIDRTGYGILAFITNNTYIDGITHRCMRQSLLETFTDIYILDLHGSSKREDGGPDGAKDENVFDIQQGVAISIFIKRPESRKIAKVHHAELWGLRKDKYSYLVEEDVSTTKWTDMEPKPKYFFLVPKNFDVEPEYMTGWSLNSIFSIQQNGLKTDRDDLFFDIERVSLESRIKTFYSEAGMEPQFREAFRIENSTSYDLLSRRRKTSFNSNNVHKCLYRPFDKRWLYYTPGLTSRPAWNVMRHMLAGKNIALLSCRQQADIGFHHILCSRIISECCAVSLKTREITSVFPLYIYPDEKKETLFDTDIHADNLHRYHPNLSQAFIADISKKLNMQFVVDGKGNIQTTFGPEDFFNYMYAVFHSPTYRERYAEFLKIDFPRLPLTSNIEVFRELCALGERLVALHLMENFGKAAPNYPEEGNNMVEKVEYLVTDKQPEQGRVFINKTQYFDGVPQHIWDFHVGGYQVCHKWLKDRKGRTLIYEDIKHYQQIVAALSETITLMNRIDEAIEEHGGWPIT